METIEEKPDGGGQSIGIVFSRFNEEVGGKLLASTLATLRAGGVDEKKIVLVKVPGAFEIPAVARRLGARVDIDGVLALGVLVRGETPHFDQISSAVSRALMSLSIELEKPVIFGVLTCDTWEQAEARVAGDEDRGKYAAEAVMEMARLHKRRDLDGR